MERGAVSIISHSRAIADPGSAGSAADAISSISILMAQRCRILGSWRASVVSQYARLQRRLDLPQSSRHLQATDVTLADASSIAITQFGVPTATRRSLIECWSSGGVCRASAGELPGSAQVRVAAGTSAGDCSQIAGIYAGSSGNEEYARSNGSFASPRCVTDT